MKFLKTFEELSTNDYRNDDPISKLKVMELIYDTLMDNGGDNINLGKVEDQELDMESSEISFKYEGVPFKLLIERVEGIKECADSTPPPGSPDAPTLPRKNTVKRIKKLGKKSGVNKSTNVYGGKNSLKGKIAIKESVNDDFTEITTPIGSDDFKLFSEIVNKGIDSYLEAFIKSKFYRKGDRYVFNFHKDEIDILLRRLQEMWEASDEDEDIYQWIEDIKNLGNNPID